MSNNKKPGPISVFVENEAGSEIKHHYNEETFAVTHTENVGVAYPFPYGFVPNTLAPDGDAADCFVITTEVLPTGTTILCDPVALVEQTEGGDTDNNVIAVPVGDPVPDLEAVQAAIGYFVERFLVGVPGRESVMGRLLPAEDAFAYLDKCARAYRQASG